MHVEPARPEEIAPALHLVFQHLPGEERSRRVANALNLLRQGELVEAGIHVARQGDQLAGAVVGLPLTGAGGLVWLPGALDGPEQAVCEDLLIESVCSWLEQAGAKVIQSILLAAELSRAAPLLSNGFAHVTQLLYLSHQLQAIPSPGNLGIRLHTYAAENDALFRQTLAATYEVTLDCPELNGVRTIDEIIEGHKAQGAFDPSRWWLATREERPVGVAMITRMPDTCAWDISYVGVIPSARGAGVGRALVARAIRQAELLEMQQLTVAVDVRNTPARQLYEQLGFEHAASREVFLRFAKNARARRMQT